MNLNINKLMTMLKPGSDNAVKKVDIEAAFNMSNRNARNLIKQARRKGIIIISTSKTNGYYLPSSREDIEHFVAEGEHRIAEIAATIKPAKDHLKALDGQERID